MALPDIILLNGCSSAGKTSIARALQAQLPGLWLHVGIDHFLRMTPLRFHGVAEGVQLVPQPDGTVPLQLGPIGQAVIASFHRAVHAIAEGGTPVVVDDVMFERPLVEHWLTTLEGLDVFSVAVHCELEELQRRELARGDRSPGQARSQFPLVHGHTPYDFSVDSTASSAQDCARAIVSALANRQPKSAFERARSG
jgi:chloramphenicol 3-O phosphotransferase